MKQPRFEALAGAAKEKRKRPLADPAFARNARPPISTALHNKKSDPVTNDLD
jgi:hypothetical protein